MYIIVVLLACLLRVGHARHMESSFEDKQKLGVLNNLQALQTLFQTLVPVTAFNPSGLGHAGSFSPSSKGGLHRASQIKMESPWKKSRHPGTVKWYDTAKKIGSITMENGEEIFACVKGIDVSQKVRGIMTLNAGERVEFNIKDQRSGGVEAVDITGPLGSNLRGLPEGAIEQETTYSQQEENWQVVSESLTGTVAHWIRPRGYGFIMTDKGEKIMVPYMCIDQVNRARGIKELVKGERVQFDIAVDMRDNSRRKAVNVAGVPGVELKGYQKEGVTQPLRERFAGTVEFWNSQKGFGFIKKSNDEGDSFMLKRLGIHPDQRNKGVEDLIVGEKVEFRFEGKNLKAFDVTGPGFSDLQFVAELQSKEKTQGTVRNVFEESGWASIQTDDGHLVFAHVSAIHMSQKMKGITSLSEGEKVEFITVDSGVFGEKPVNVIGQGGADLKGNGKEFAGTTRWAESVLKSGVKGVVKSWNYGTKVGVVTLDSGAEIEVPIYAIEMSQAANGIRELLVGEEVEFKVIGMFNGDMQVDDVTGPGGADLKCVADDRRIGMVSQWFADRDFGYVESSDGQKHFTRRKSISPVQQKKGVRSLTPGQMVEFTTKPAAGGEVVQGLKHPQAVDVTGPGGTDLKDSSPEWAPRITGRLGRFNDEKKFGFIVDDSGKDVFVHLSAFSKDGKELARPPALVEGVRLEFRAQQGMAFDVTRPGGVSLWEEIEEGEDVPEHLPRSSGIVKWFNTITGWGTIVADNGDTIDVHESYISKALQAEGVRTLAEGERVEFGVWSRPDQRTQAADVIILEDVPQDVTEDVAEPVPVR
mmetsp:Transcript_133927/g.250546  ORF Transcript_133927/g.250546 Transcript_133927/m.250546 type:complete len:812 (-) Transcript_133927:8-2443(-)